MRILFVAKPGVIHTARWIDELIPQNWDIQLFSPYPSSDLTIHDEMPPEVLVHLIVKQGRSKTRQTGLWFPTQKGDRFRLWITRLRETFQDRAHRLADLIRETKPDIVHSLEMQGATYLVLAAKKILEDAGHRFPAWIYSSWGSDIYFFANQDEHREQIREALSNIDFYIADCQRDVSLAREFGFAGTTLGVFPTGGGFDVASMATHRIPISERQIILVKGITRDENVGRAGVALEAVAQCRERLSNYRILVHQAGSDIVNLVQEINQKSGMQIEILPPVSHDQFVRLVGTSRISIGLSISDGSPNTMLEAMIMGSFPIQSDTVSTSEWIINGQNGLLVDPENVGDVQQAILKAIDDEDLLERAMQTNFELVKGKLDRVTISREVVRLYEAVKAGEVLTEYASTEVDKNIGLD